MGAKTSISWAGSTWNYGRGCRRTAAEGSVQSGCGDASGGGCYAERQAARFCGPGMPYEGLVKITKNGPRWTGQVKFVVEHLADPLRWRDSRLIFVDSMTDAFHEGYTNEQIAAAFGVMAAAKRHTFQVLTKRSKRMREWFAWLRATVDPYPAGALALFEECAVDALSSNDKTKGYARKVSGLLGCKWPLPNVWLAVSCENQAAANERIPDLLMTPASVRFLSVEPMIGRVDLMPWLDPTGACCGSSELQCEGCPTRSEWRGSETRSSIQATTV